MQPQSQIPSADKHKPHVARGAHHEQLKLPERLRRTQLLHVIQHQPDPPIQSAQARQQALGQRTSVKARRRRQVSDQPRTSARPPNGLPDRQPEAKGIPLLNPNRDPRSPIGKVLLGDPTADQRRLAAPSRTGDVDHTSRPIQHVEQPATSNQTAGPANRTSNTHPDSMLDHEHMMQATMIERLKLHRQARGSRQRFRCRKSRDLTTARRRPDRTAGDVTSALQGSRSLAERRPARSPNPCLLHRRDQCRHVGRASAKVGRSAKAGPRREQPRRAQRGDGFRGSDDRFRAIAWPRKGSRSSSAPASWSSDRFQCRPSLSTSSGDATGAWRTEQRRLLRERVISDIGPRL